MASGELSEERHTSRNRTGLFCNRKSMKTHSVRLKSAVRCSQTVLPCRSYNAHQTSTECCLEVAAQVRLSNASWAVWVSLSPSNGLREGGGEGGRKWHWHDRGSEAKDWPHRTPKQVWAIAHVRKRQAAQGTGRELAHRWPPKTAGIFVSQRVQYEEHWWVGHQRV